MVFRVDGHKIGARGVGENPEKSDENGACSACLMSNDQCKPPI